MIRIDIFSCTSVFIHFSLSPLFILPLVSSSIMSVMVFCLDSCTWRLSSNRLHTSHPLKSGDIMANPSCAGTEHEQHVASSISQFTAGSLCSQSGWIPLLDVRADIHQLCTCRRFYNCVFGRCSENSLLSASPDKVKTTFFLSFYIPFTTFSSRHMLKHMVKVLLLI